MQLPLNASMALFCPRIVASLQILHDTPLLGLPHINITQMQPYLVNEVLITLQPDTSEFPIER